MTSDDTGMPQHVVHRRGHPGRRRDRIAGGQASPQLVGFIRTSRQRSAQRRCGSYGGGQLHHPPTPVKNLAGQASPRFHLHLTPRSSSWLNLVEPRFDELTHKAIGQGAFPCVPDLTTANDRYMQVHNDEPKALTWIAAAESTLTRFRRGPVALSRTLSR
jgi:hypothetical protein